MKDGHPRPVFENVDLLGWPPLQDQGQEKVAARVGDWGVGQVADDVKAPTDLESDPMIGS